MGTNQFGFLVTISSDLNSTIVNTLLYALLGLGIVFFALIFISGIVSIIRYFTKGHTDQRSTGFSNEGAQVYITRDNSNLVNDLELVAVITAAIQAYEEANGNAISNNGLIVRSIRKVNKSKWQ